MKKYHLMIKCCYYCYYYCYYYYYYHCYYYYYCYYYCYIYCYYHCYYYCYYCYYYCYNYCYYYGYYYCFFYNNDTYVDICIIYLSFASIRGFKQHVLCSKLVADRPTNRQTDIATYRAAIAAKKAKF